MDQMKKRDGRGGPRIFPLREDTAPTLHPTSQDIAWAAGIYEGEGCIDKSKECGFGRGLKVTVTQKDTWILDRLRELFGGTVSTQLLNVGGFTANASRMPIWRLSGARAHGFTMTIYQFLSPRRQEQLKKAWGKRIEQAA